MTSATRALAIVVLVGGCGGGQHPGSAADRLTQYSEAVSSRAAPLEACGPRASYVLVARLACDDGSTPLGGDPAQGSDARVGNMGLGGPHNHILDLYRVSCPERTYELWIDMYVCGS